MQTKLQSTDENAAILRNLMKELKVNLAESQELEIVYYKRHVKKRLYWPEKFDSLSAKHIKTNQNSEFEYKYFDSF